MADLAVQMDARRLVMSSNRKKVVMGGGGERRRMQRSSGKKIGVGCRLQVEEGPTFGSMEYMDFMGDLYSGLSWK
jgi:hypothetical protein